MNIDFDKAWSSLKPELDKEQARREKKKRRFIIFFWSTAIVIGISAGMLYFKKSDSNTSLWVNVSAKEAKGVSSNRENRNSSNESNQSVTHSANQTDLPTVENKKLSQNEKPDNKNTIVKTENNILPKRNNLVMEDKLNLHNDNKLMHKEKYSLHKQKNLLHNTNNLVHSRKKLLHKQNILLQKGNKTLLNDDKDVLAQNKTNENHSPQNIDNELVQNSQDKNLMLQSQTEQSGINNEITATSPNLNPTKNVAANTTTASTAQQQTPKKENTKKWQYGVQLNIPLVRAYNFLDANSEKNIPAAIIPTVWVSKSFGKKSSALLFVNPYSSYYASSKAIANTGSYKTITQQASQQAAEQSSYTQTIAFNKLIGIEAGLVYQYQIKPKLFIGGGFSSFLTQSVLLQNKVVKNNKNTVTDNIYSVGQSDDEWRYIQQNFVLAQMEIAYSFKHLNAGLKLIKPVTSVFQSVEVNKTPLNTNLFVRWKF